MGGPDGGLGNAGMDASVGAPMDAGVPETSCDGGSLPGGVPPVEVVTPGIVVLGVPVVLVKKAYMNPARRPVLLMADDAGFDGTGTFTVSNAHIRFFTDRTGGTEIRSGHVFQGPELGAVVTLWAQGATPSGAMDDVHLTLALTPGSKPVNPPAHANMTSVEVTLDIHKTRTAQGAEPAMLTIAEKTGNTGRIVHVQDTSRHHGRALLIVRKAAPAAFTGTLVLTGDNGEVRIFDDPHETGAAGLLGLPLVLPNAAIPATGRRLWAEGANVSPSLGHTGFHLGVVAVDNEGDRVKMTSVQFSNLSAVVSSTPPNRVRMANGPILSHTTFHGGHAAADYAENFTANKPLILIENSLPAAKNVNLSVTIRPNMRIGWSIQRNKFTASPDRAEIAALSRSEPSLAATAAGALTAHLKLDSVGSFHIRPFVDVDGAGQFEYNDNAGNRIDREPFIIMNLVLVRAQGFQNHSVQQTVNATAQDLSGNVPIIAVNGVQFSSGQWTAATAAVHNIATITLIAGGPDGRLGLDGSPARVFAGWVNNITRRNVVRSYLDATVAPPAAHSERYIWASNAPAPPGSFGIFYQAALPAPAGASSSAAPALLAAPLLDTTNFGNEGRGGNTCVGTEGNPGPPVAIVKTNLPDPSHPGLNYGQDWTVEQWDSPGSGAGSNATMHPAAILVDFTYEYDFRCDLVVWTNFTRAPGATDDAACRLYASVQSDRWTVRYRIRFDPPGSATAGTGHQVTAPAVTMTKDPSQARVAIAVEGSGLEIRFPISLNCSAVDATS